MCKRVEMCFDNLEKVDKFLEMHSLPRLNHEDT